MSQSGAWSIVNSVNPGPIPDECVERCADAIEEVYERVFVVASRASTALDFRDRLDDARRILAMTLENR